MKLNPFALAFVALSGVCIFTAVETPEIAESPTVQAIEYLADRIDETMYPQGVTQTEYFGPAFDATVDFTQTF